MTALNPQQMRELANQPPFGNHQLREALRSAADQLEAVREWADSSDRELNWDALDAILTADTAPQEDVS